MNHFLKKLIPLDIICISYVIITGVYLFLGIGILEDIHWHFLFRIFVIVFIFLVVYLNEKISNILVQLVRNLYPLLFLATTYGESDYMNNLWFDYQDAFFSAWDQSWFACQPSIEFSRNFSSPLFSELMYFGYFSYYLVIYFTSIWLFFKDKILCQKFFFIMICSFFVYYFIYILLPVAGPIYYFPQEMTITPDGYLFSEAVKFFQKVGEVPTAAFPSSHVGISAIILISLWKEKRNIFWIILPFSIILCFATVYIKAHYLIDVIGGFVSVPIIYWISQKLFKTLNKKELIIGV